MKKVFLFSFIVLFSFLMNFHSDVYAVTLKDKSTIIFDGAPDGKVYTTRKVWVPKGGYLGVYGHNNNSDLGHTWLYFRVYRDDGTDVTDQFWREDPDWGYFLNEEEIVNKRVGPIKEGHSYYIWAQCEFRWAPIGTGCDGTFTISSWY
ncbi:hypothetical protein [Saccharococcus caldoxylosilyticus]|uniref:DUF4879 domain-containing protein n=2 Tax=Saccharococcus caldoxylosilyticus TaxID=81408 RepID=A0A023DJR5_9BACL|nr:hypothetical protein [Parageobacillus caldoxylosilyticus]OQO97682.1 hypothetical protein BSK33_17820 [Geobacillus sp. 44B]QNU39672.1 hypothetical protein IC801_17825 [Geobacillus sp. 44B]QXJ37117.1 hypothetical protein BV455_00379 [Parageobacillus caldoxylosilyticus]BDG35404.1 hypothetical protein PcaKH15_13100 [Parageobacillus caldoxylosilyticus]BDG39182.1 hypothetical protein PcaKH16_13210 [Parageobacillus caldoxylosilyticus]